MLGADEHRPRSSGGDVTLCQRPLPGEPYDYPCKREAVYKGLCWQCAWVELPQERDLLPPRVKTVKPPSTPKKKRNKRPEDLLQMACCDFLDLHPSILYFSIPNHLYLGAGNEYQKMHYIAKQKAMGFTPGASDLCMVFRNKHGASVTCFAELKDTGKKPSEAQVNFMEKANERGCFTATIYSIHDLQLLLSVAGY